MRFNNLTRLCDFIQVLYSTGNLRTKNLYFSKRILFSTIYLLQKQKLNPSNCSKHEIIKSNFEQDTEWEMYMHAKIEYLDIYICL
jgi:hypothetical protein